MRSEFTETIPGCLVAEGVPSPGPIEMLEEPRRDLLKVDPSEMTERELLMSIVLELRAARADRKAASRALWR